MDDDDHRNYIINLRLMKLTGFYQLINPNTSKYYGYSPYKVVATIEIMFGVFSVSVLILSSYYYLYNTNELMNHFMLAVAIFFSTFKLFCVSRNSELIWDCMDMTSVQFLSYTGHRRDALRTARAKSITLSILFLLLWGSVTVAWCLSPFIVDGVYLDVEINGKVRQYRYNSLNYVYPVGERFYNDHFLAFYAVEMLQVVSWGHATIAYDTFVISMCIAIQFQLKTIADSYSTLCYGTVSEAYGELVCGRTRPCSHPERYFSSRFRIDRMSSSAVWRSHFRSLFALVVIIDAIRGLDKICSTHKFNCSTPVSFLFFFRIYIIYIITVKYHSISTILAHPIFGL
jgi:hypothetical protein